MPGVGRSLVTKQLIKIIKDARVLRAVRVCIYDRHVVLVEVGSTLCTHFGILTRVVLV